MRKKKLEKIKKKIESLKPELKERFKVKEIGIFGSLVRGEEKKKSDIDILVDFKEDADLFDFVGLSLFPEEKLKQKVDVVPKRALREEIKDLVLKETITL